MSNPPYTASYSITRGSGSVYPKTKVSKPRLPAKKNKKNKKIQQ